MFLSSNLFKAHFITDQIANKIPWWFWLVSVIALLWNLIGVAAFISGITMSDEVFHELIDAEKELYKNKLMWFVYGVAVFGSLLASIGLLLRKHRQDSFLLFRSLLSLFKWATVYILAKLRMLIIRQHILSLQ